MFQKTWKFLKEMFKQEYFVLALIFIFAVFVRVYDFPNNPPGINQDEQASAYEAYSLLTTGKDKWGYTLPVYFPAWGSGQNVMYAYLTVPSIAIFGLNTFAVRLPALIMALATIIFFYFILRKQFDLKTAQIGTFLLATLPWHVMMSRWSLESNALPFFVALGILTVMYALDYSKSKLDLRKKIFIAISLIPLAFGLYAYAIGVFVVPVFFALILFFHFKTLKENKKIWLIAFGLFMIFAMPLGLFLIKNNIIKADLPFESLLPFSLPLLPESRLDQVTGDMNVLATLYNNLKFFFSGFRDGLTWNTPNDYLPLSPFVLPFALLSMYVLARDLKARKLNLVFAMFLAYVPTLFIFDHNINRFNAGLLMLVGLGAYGFTVFVEEFSKRINNKKISKNWLSAIFIIIMSLHALLFFGYYEISYRNHARDAFNYGMDGALKFAKKEIPENSKVYVSTSAAINYSYYLYHTETHPDKFREEVRYEVKRGSFNVLNIGDYYFSEDYFVAVKKEKPYYAVLKKDDKSLCKCGKVLYTNDYWRVEEYR